MRTLYLVPFVLLFVLTACADDALTPANDLDAEATAEANALPHVVYTGETTRLGQGRATTFAWIQPNGRPAALGVRLTRAAFEGLPTAMSDERACYDLDASGTIDVMTECPPGHEHLLALPAAVAEKTDTPFQYVMLNWNPMGHPPPEVYTLPHFDVHFYIQDYAEVRAMEAGPCPGLMTCDDFERATVPVPDAYRPQDYIDVGAVEVMMGNHLIDPTGPEYNGETFTHTFIYGAYDGAITFYEPMVTRDFLLSEPNACYPLKRPAAFERSGFYPKAYCIRSAGTTYTVTLEDFIYRVAS